MKTPALPLFLASAVLLPQLFAQGMLPTDGGNQPQPAPQIESDVIADWVKELSNLSAEDRALYTSAFAQAKNAYAKGLMAECESHLNTCEFYTTSNPNVWNLRASVRISQQRFDEAKPLLDAVRRFNPQDAVARLSYSLLYLGTGEYEKCIAETDALLEEIRYRDMMQLTHSLIFRKVLCCLMLGREEDARALVADVSPVDDSPLYYYSQAMFSLVKGDRRSATRDLNTADTIYATIGYLSGYKQAVSFSGITEKFTTRK
ncbi:MAG: tetratricopeptide repeat protein [Akkermansia sp.]|nr:tetratricopeptide repeat protein [Akkermansia sp.]